MRAERAATVDVLSAGNEHQICDVTWHVRCDDYQLTTGWLIRRRALTIDAIYSRPIRQVR